MVGGERIEGGGGGEQTLSVSPWGKEALHRSSVVQVGNPWMTKEFGRKRTQRQLNRNREKKNIAAKGGGRCKIGRVIVWETSARVLNRLQGNPKTGHRRGA